MLVEFFKKYQFQSQSQHAEAVTQSCGKEVIRIANIGLMKDRIKRTIHYL